MKDVRAIWGQFDLDNIFPYEKGILILLKAYPSLRTVERMAVGSY